MLKVCNWAGFQEFEPLFGCDELLKISLHYSTIPVVHSTVYTLPNERAYSASFTLLMASMFSEAGWPFKSN